MSGARLSMLAVPLSTIAAAALVALSTLALLYWRSGKGSSASVPPYAQTRRELEVADQFDREQRRNRATAMILASVAWKGAEHEFEDILSLADEILQYIEGDDAAMPRADTLKKGRIPR